VASSVSTDTAAPNATAAHLVIGPNGQHVLQKAGQRLAWPVGSEPHIRPAWATKIPVTKPSRGLA